jgi:probable F420-dependent oxidoreductase
MVDTRLQCNAVKLDLFLYTPQAGEMIESVRQAEEEGFDGLFVAETVSDPFIALAIAGQHSERITLGTGIALAFPRSPMLTAIAARDLQVLSGGRFVLGLGAQVKKHIERRFSMPYDHPAARMREYVSAVRAIWAAFDGERELQFRGEFFTLDFLPRAVNPGPLPAPPPIYLAAVGPHMFRTAGEVADGALVHPLHTVQYLEQVAKPSIAEGMEASGRDPREFSLGVTVLAAVGNGAERARQRELVRRQLAYYASTPSYRRVLELHGWQDVGETLSKLVRGPDLPGMAAAIPGEMLDAFSVTADSWEEAVSIARARYEGVADRVAFHVAPPVGALAAAAVPMSR